MLPSAKSRFSPERHQTQRFGRHAGEQRHALQHDDILLECHPSRLSRPAPPSAPSGNELVAAALGDQQFGLARIAFDLLPETIDVRLQRVRRDAQL